MKKKNKWFSEKENPRLPFSKQEGGDEEDLRASGIAFPPESEAQLQRLLVVGLGQVP